MRNDIDKKMDEVKNSSKEAWENTKKDLDNFRKKSDSEWTEFKHDFKELFR